VNDHTPGPVDDLNQAGVTTGWEKGVVLTATELEGCAPAADWSRWIARGRAPVSTPPVSGPGAGVDPPAQQAEDDDGMAAPGTTAGSGRPAAARAEDLDQLAGLGIDAVMLTLEWARLEPRPGQIDGAAVEAQLDQLRAARARGLRVWACLVDGTLPGWFVDDEGGFGDERARGLLWPRHVDWAGEVFGPEVDGWVPQREPLLWALRRHLLGEAPPGDRDVRTAARAVQSAMLAEGEAWRLLRGTAPVATYQTARTVVAQTDPSDGRRGDGGARAQPLAQLVERLLWHPWLSALTEGELVVADLPTRTVDHLRGAFDRVVVELRPAVQVDGAGAWKPYPPERPIGPSGWAAWVEGMGESLHRTADALGDHEIIGAGSLADVSDDGRARPDHIQAVLTLIDEAARTTSVAGWWQTSPIDGYHWQRGFTVQPGLIDRNRRESAAAEAFRRFPR
jgi:beta-glucosidase